MSPELIVSTVAISLALLFYTWGVFGERRHGSLNLKYVLLFWAGLACDTTGTLIMSNIASQSNATGFGIHGLTGALAIVLMIVHALWATFTYLRGSQQARRRFHTFSTVVWLLWLVPYIIGMLVGIPAIHLKAVCAIGHGHRGGGASGRLPVRSRSQRRQATLIGPWSWPRGIPIAGNGPLRFIAQGHGSAGKHCRSAACEQCRRTDIAFDLAICAIIFRMSGRLSAAT
ncbi:HsmA family protein [Adlercreutzia caecimuris]|uniref:HsmA family protein n=1 Tax=Adlercreutzia caecimuris TaxID=671266 RepID=UPI001F3D70B8|nr:HsmA family protein [Adlercreutzia caecimuris]